MRVLVPVYYHAFRCAASSCRHTCCAGWEICVDPDAKRRYLACSGPLGEELREQMTVNEDGETVFRLCEDGRCPFLTEDGLCRVILEMGEDGLCRICADHPRWRNGYAYFEEMGLGMACEAAAGIILSEKRKAVMVPLGEADEDAAVTEEEDAFFRFRDRVLRILWDRRRPIGERLARLEDAGLACRIGEPIRWRERLLSLERLEETWTEALEALSPEPYDFSDETAAEQAAVYFVMRHLSGALEDGLIRERCGLAVLLTRLLFALARDGETADWARRLSAEIEYSDENVPRLLEWMAADEETGT